MNDPWMIFAVATAITITGVIIINVYDISLSEATTYTWTHIKKGFVATIAIIWKLIKWIGSKNNPRPPIEPSNPDMPVNPNIPVNPEVQQVSETGPMLLARSPQLDEVLPERSVHTHDSDEETTTSKGEILPEYTTQTTRNVIEDLVENHVSSKRDFSKLLDARIKNFDSNDPTFKHEYSMYKPMMLELTNELDRLFSVPGTEAIKKGRIEGLLKLEDLYMKIPQKEGTHISDLIPLFQPVASTSNITVSSSSPVRTEGLNIENAFNNDEIPFTLSPNPMSSNELEISPAKNVDNMTRFNGLTINDISTTYDKFIKIALFNKDEVEKFIKLRAECLDREHEGYNEAFENSKVQLRLLQEEMERLMELPVDSSVLSARKDCLLRFEQYFCQIPHRNNLGLIEAIDTYNMHLNPDLYNKPDQPLYDIGAIDRYANQLDLNLDYDSPEFQVVKNIYGNELYELYNEIERLNYLPKNSHTNKALYDVYMKLVDLLDKYPSLDPIESIHKSPFIKPKTASNEFLSIEDIPEL